MTVVDAAGAEIGELLDVVARCASETAVVTGFFIECDGCLLYTSDAADE